MLLQQIRFGLILILTLLGGLVSSGQAQTTVSRTKLTQTSEARRLLRQAKTSALQIKNEFQRGLILDEIGAAEVKAGELNAAVATAKLAYPHTMATLTAIGKSLGRSGDLAAAKALQPKLKGGGGSTVLAFFSETQAEEGRFPEALKASQLIEAPEVRADALQAIAERQAAKGNYNDALKTLEMVEAADPSRQDNTIQSQMIMLEAKAKEGEVESARAIIEAIKSPEERSFAMVGMAESRLVAGDKAAAAEWIDQALKEPSTKEAKELVRYFVIPLEVKLGQKSTAMDSAGTMKGEMRLESLMAVAVTCAEIENLDCVNIAIERMKFEVVTNGKQEDISEFQLSLMLLNVTAALIQNNQFDFASSLMSQIEQYKDELGHVKPRIQFLRAFILASSKNFEAARTLTLKIRPDSIAETERGEALRITALLQTRRHGTRAPRQWAFKLRDPEDRAYSSLGIAQALLDIGGPKLSYSAIQMH